MTSRRASLRRWADPGSAALSRSASDASASRRGGVEFSIASSCRSRAARISRSSRFSARACAACASRRFTSRIRRSAVARASFASLASFRSFAAFAPRCRASAAASRPTMAAGRPPPPPRPAGSQAGAARAAASALAARRRLRFQLAKSSRSVAESSELNGSSSYPGPEPRACPRRIQAERSCGGAPPAPLPPAAAPLPPAAAPLPPAPSSSSSKAAAASAMIPRSILEDAPRRRYSRMRFAAARCAFITAAAGFSAFQSSSQRPVIARESAPTRARSRLTAAGLSPCAVDST